MSVSVKLDLAADRWARVMPAIVRIAIGLLYMQNSFWKVPPDFGKATGSLLYAFVRDAVVHPVFAPYTWLVKHLVLPHFTFFGWMVLLVESTLGALLVLGLATRLVGLAGALYTVTIALSTLNAPHEWTWSYYLWILAELAVSATAAGRVFGLDAILRPACQRSDRRLARAYLWAS
jgi:thiosulfate dehydrogenase (quinone) large subunit